MSKSVTIIGGGVGGLFTGALLAKNGYIVTVLEKNATIGGGLQTFRRHGEIFDTGMHMLGGFRKGGSIYRICNYLGIMESLKIYPTDDKCMDSIHYLAENEYYEIPGGRSRFTEYFCGKFPSEADNICRYVDAMYRLSKEVRMFNLEEDTDAITCHSDDFLLPADQFIAKYISDPRLREILAYMNSMYGGVEGHTPAYIHALVNVLYINGKDCFIDGSLQLANVLARVISENGGRVLSNAKVVRIDCEDKTISHAETADGTKYSSDYYISAIHPCSMLQMLDTPALSKAYRSRLNNIPNTHSTFMVFLTLKENSFPYINHTGYCQRSHGTAWQLDKYDDMWPRGIMYMTPPTADQGQFSRRMIILTPMSFEAVRQWENTSVGNRGPEYRQWKHRNAERMLDLMEAVYPGFRNKIETIETSSPLTIRDYYNVKDGAMYGYRKDAMNMAMSQIPIETKISNLLLTGQNINLHGICGVPLTAVNTAEALLGKNRLIHEINSKYKTDNETC